MAKKKRRAKPPEPPVETTGSESPWRDSVVQNRQAIAVIGALMACAIVVRWASPSSMAVEHFDEAVYSSNLFFGAEYDFQFPGRPLYAPPLLPSLIEICHVAGQTAAPGQPTSALWTFAPSLMAGLGSFVLLSIIGYRWFGLAAGVAAGALIACSDYHGQYSRSALTESMMLMWFLGGLALLFVTMRTGKWYWAVAAGLVVAAGWWTKYNGWLPLPIALVAIVFAAAIATPGSDERRQLKRRLLLWLLAAAVAVCAWSPYVWSLRDTGGYSVISANHQQYIVGLQGWFDSLVQQTGNLRHFDGWLGTLAMGAACLAIPLAESRGRLSIQGLVWCVMVTAITAVVGVTLMIALLAAIAAVFAIKHWTANRQASLPAAFLTVWVVSLALATPLYHPYPRLALPLMAGLWLAAAVGLHQVTQVALTRWPRNATTDWGVFVAGLTVLIGATWLQFRPVPVSWQYRGGARDVAIAIEQDWIDTRSAQVFVYGHPAIFYHLASRGISSFPMRELDLAGGPTAAERFVVIGPYGVDVETERRRFEQDGGYEWIATYRCTQSDLVRLNQQTAADIRRDPDEYVSIYVYRETR